MNSKHVLVAVTGGIAVYKACDLVSKLTKKGYEVKVMMTKSAAQFVTPLPFQALSHNDVFTDMFEAADVDPIPHISLAGWADILIVAPATANIIAKAVCGLADDLVSSTILACTCPKILCPAMNMHMLENPVTQRNIQTARELGWTIVEPDSGHLACMEDGKGRLPDTAHLIESLEAVLYSSQTAPAAQKAPAKEEISDDPLQSEWTGDPQSVNQPWEDEKLLEEAMDRMKPLKGKHVLISAGPTKEALDPVRFISNHSSGKQGYAIAKAAKKWGADVILVSGPVSLETPADVERISVSSALEMEKAMLDHAQWADFIIMAAAVADYRPKQTASSKIKKSDDFMTVEFVKNPDILKQLGQNKRKDQVLCGFAMETENLDFNARQKLEAKNCDMLIANNLTTQGAGFQTDTNIVSLLKPDAIEHLPILSKEELGFKILAQMLEISKGKR